MRLKKQRLKSEGGSRSGPREGSGRTMGSRREGSPEPPPAQRGQRSPGEGAGDALPRQVPVLMKGSDGGSVLQGETWGLSSEMYSLCWPEGSAL